MSQALEFIGAGDKISFTVEFNQGTDPAAGVHIGLNQSLTGDALGLLRSLKETFGLEGLKSLINVALGFSQGITALHNASAAFLTQSFNRFSRYLQCHKPRQY